MPFYEYECSACKFYVEALQKISDPPLEKCPSCGKQTMQRLISAPVFRLKGSGWYETDFKSDKENKRNLVDDKEPAASSDSDDKDDKKVKVRASKALKKVAAKKTGKKKAAVKGKAGKSSARPAKKPVKRAAAKAAPAKKKSAKKSTQKSAKKATKKPVGKATARKK